MARELLGYYNSSYGNGFEGLINWTNTVTDNWFIPAFLMVFYSLSIYILSRSEWKLGGVILFTSFLFFIIGMIMQTVTQFNQLIMFIFTLGMIIGLIISFVENAK